MAPYNRVGFEEEILSEKKGEWREVLQFLFRENEFWGALNPLLLPEMKKLFRKRCNIFI